MPIIGRKPIGTMAYMGGVPATLENFTWAWGQLIHYSAYYACDPLTEYIDLAKSKVSFHSWARNGLTEQFLGDWLFMLDTDHEPDPSTLARLLHRMHTYKFDVIAGIYQFKDPPHPPVLFGWLNTPEGQRVMGVVGEWDRKLPLRTMAGVGSGCLLVHRRVFDRIREELREKPFDVYGQSGEDMSFFMRLDKLKIKAWVDMRVECPHVVTRSIRMKDYKPPKLMPAKTTNVEAIAEV